MKTGFALLLIIALTCCKQNASKATTSYNSKAKKSKKASKNTNFPSFQPDSLDIKIGQMILVGINDRTTLSDLDPLRYEILTQKVGGIILFEKNITKTESKQNLQNLIADLQDDAQRPLFISIDEEGGKVHRLKEKYGFVSMPSAAYLGSFENIDSTTYYTR
ncbi:MAG TPA: glycoside hydrolase family 3 N-terminal domain-containing protein, partial [Cytophagaceae bacterium]